MALGEVFAAGAVSCVGAAAMGAGALVEAEAVRVLAGALPAASFGAVLAWPGAATGRGESATALGVDGSLPAPAGGVVEATLLLVSATRDSAGTGGLLAFDSAGVLSEEDVIRSSTIAPPITTAVIIPIATPKWFTALLQ